MPRRPALLKKATPAVHARSTGSTRSAPTRTLEPRGSLTTAERKASCFDFRSSARSASGPEPRSGPPARITRVGSPPVWESTISTALGVRAGMSLLRLAPSALAQDRFLGCRFRRPGLDRPMDDRKSFRALLSLERQARSADRLRAAPRLRHRELDVLDELRMRVHVEERGEPAVQRARLIIASARGEVPKKEALLGEGIDESRDPTLRAEEGAFEDEVVDAREEDITVAQGVRKIGDSSRIVGGFLDRDERLLIGQLRKHFRSQIDADRK